MQDETLPWSPNVRTGAAWSPERFVIALGRLEYDDPFTAIVSYDGTARQPWRRVDVRREIHAVGYLEPQEEGLPPTEVALSNEGDVYLIDDGGVERSKIPGAGVASEDAAGFGGVYTLLTRGNSQIVLGRGRQMYAREGRGEWRTLSADASAPTGYRAEDFGEAAFLRDRSVLIATAQVPAGPQGGFAQDPRYRPNMETQEVVALMRARREEAAGGSHITRLYHYHDGNFNRLDISENTHIRGIYIDPLDRAWVLGTDGLILHSIPEQGFKQVGFHGDTVTLLSAAWFQNELILASDHALHRFDGHHLTPLKPKLDPTVNGGVPTPNRLQVVDGILFLFDYKHGVCRWDGTTWDWVDIPSQLREREFLGLDL